ncbi:MAG: hypothetical protein H0U10_14860 [Chloroflexia bacterium]|nr:hypothetical protein [Chloroflexia bacterium]
MFDSQAGAQAVLEATEGDPFDLDPDQDGLACEEIDEGIEAPMDRGVAGESKELSVEECAELLSWLNETSPSLDRTQEILTEVEQLDLFEQPRPEAGRLFSEYADDFIEMADRQRVVTQPEFTTDANRYFVSAFNAFAESFDLLSSAVNEEDQALADEGSEQFDRGSDFISEASDSISTLSESCTAVTTSSEGSLPSSTMAPEVELFEGNGDGVSDTFTLVPGVAVFSLSHEGSANFAVLLYDEQGEIVDLLVNTIGSFGGSAAIGLPEGGEYIANITADGPWQIEIDQSIGNVLTPPASLSGSGSTASQFVQLEPGLARFSMSHEGDSNFAIVVYRDDGTYVDLLVNEIGNYEGAQATPIERSGTYILDIEAGGTWEVLITQ